MLNRFVFSFLICFFLFDYFSDVKVSNAVVDKAPIDIDSLITTKAREYGFEPALIHALVEVESSKNQYRASSKGALGLTQVVPKWHLKRCGLKSKDDLFIPFKNLNCGLSHLRELTDKYGTFNALRAYNGGTGCINRNCGKENQNYPHKILNKLS